MKALNRMNWFTQMIRALLVWLAFSLGAVAQETVALDVESYAAWDELAQRAEEVADRGLASSAALEVLRQDLAGWRSRFKEAEGLNSNRIASLKEQIEALGPAPEEGESEAAEVATRRAELEAQLEEAEAPVLQATSAFERANGLISEIDALISERQTTELLAADAAPVNPANWGPALASITQFMTALWSEARAPFSSDAGQQALFENIETVILLLLVAFVAFLRVAVWTRHIEVFFIERLAEYPSRLRLALLATSALHVLLPAAAFWALAEAGHRAGMDGIRISALLSYLPYIAVAYLSVRWSSRVAFAPEKAEIIHLGVDDVMRARGRRFGAAMGILIALSVFAEVVRHAAEDAALYISVLLLPVIAIAGYALVGLAKILRAAGRLVAETGPEHTFFARLLSLIGRALVVIGCVAPLLALFGYVNAAEALIWPATLTLSLLVLVVALQGALGDLWAVLTGEEDADEKGLWPTLLGLALGLAAIPLLALIWGVRWATITEMWTAFLGGIAVGDTVISPSNFLTFALVFAALYLATKLFQGVLSTTVLPKTKIDSGARNAIVSGLGYLGVILAAIVAISAAGINLAGLAIVAGALSVGIGFGLQTIVSNFVSGIILLIERPVKVGDWIEVNGTMGYVRTISVRSTRIETFDRSDVIVPNADLISGSVTNYTLQNSLGRIIVRVGVAYGTDTKAVEALLREIVEEHPMVLLSPPPAVLFSGFGADSLDFEIRAILRDVAWSLSVKSDLHHVINKRFAEAGYEIPFAQRDLWLRNPETLRGTAE